jgi:ankyrin repeat protein
MTFKRLNPSGTPSSELVNPKPRTLGLGLRSGIIESAISSGFLKQRFDNNYSDNELLKYTCAAGRKDWFDWLLKNCDFYNSRGNVRKELRREFDKALILAVEEGHFEIASHLFTLGAKIKGTIHNALYRAIRLGRHEMAELLFKHGGEIKQNARLNECIHYADERMKAIIKKGVIESINRRFKT